MIMYRFIRSEIESDRGKNICHRYYKYMEKENVCHR